MAKSEPESMDQGIPDELQNKPPLDDDSDSPDLAFLLKIARVISNEMPSVWDAIGPIWTYTTDALVDDDPETRDEYRSDSADCPEEDPSYKPNYRARDVVKWGAMWVENEHATEVSVKDAILNKMYKWLSKKGQSPRGSPESSHESEDISIVMDKPIITYRVGFLSLPYEILAAIIQLALQGDPHVVLAASHVNSALRSFTLSAPSLWTIIDISFPSERIHAHLERSGPYLLQIRASLVLLTTDVAQGISKLQGFLAIIRPHAARIASLEMRYTNASWRSIGLHGFSKASSLDEFDHGYLIHTPVPANAGTRFNCKPRKIRLEGVAMKTFSTIYSERAISLKVTECWEMGLSGWREALLLMPSLQSLEISNFQLLTDEEGEDTGSETDIPLPHLQAITLTRVPREVLIYLFGALQTPNLISATIAFLEPNGLHGYHYLARRPWLKAQPANGMSELALLPLVSKNSQLEELDLHNCCMTPNMWSAVFAQLPNLKKLRIASSDVTSEALASLVVPSGGSLPALPCLTHITLDNESLDEESGLFFPLIDQLITSRWTLFQQPQNSDGGGQTRIARLESVVLRGWNESHIPPIDELARLRGYVEHLHVETVQTLSDDDGEATDGEWETQSGGSWASGDQAVVDLGTSLHTFDWGLEWNIDWETESGSSDWLDDDDDNS